VAGTEDEWAGEDADPAGIGDAGGTQQTQKGSGCGVGTTMPAGAMGEAGGEALATAGFWSGDDHDRLVRDWGHPAL